MSARRGNADAIEPPVGRKAVAGRVSQRKAIDAPAPPQAIEKSVRRGLVLGGGGVLGGTWAVGALAALESEYGFAAQDADIIVGTSAGSVLAALIGAGVTVDQLEHHYLDEEVPDGPLAGYVFDPVQATGGPRPGLPRLVGPGSPKLIGASLRRLGQLPATAVLSAFLPEGTRSLERVGHLVDAVTPIGHWSAHRGVWVVAMDYEDGKRVVFGRPGAPVAGLSEAVVASCSIPGWFQPVTIGGHTYVDGGAVSATSVDVLAHAGLDEVYVVAPMVSFAMDRPSSIGARLERRWRAEVTKTALAEVALVRSAGATVRIVGPGPEDLAAIGANLMDDTRRRFVLETSLRTSHDAWRTADEYATAG
ncbi:MAG: patatin-like phospholipase family protein [Actinomycetales bacterium]|nr:patatin-like phospholipase family protein [Actinomycetales bacterium]